MTVQDKRTKLDGICEEIVEEDSLDGDLVNCRAEIYVKAIVTRLEQELESTCVPTEWIGCVVMLMKSLVHKLIGWLNDRTRLDGRTDCDVTSQEFYRLLSVYVLSQSTGLSQSLSISMLSSMVCSSPTTEFYTKLGNYWIPFHPSLNRGTGAGTLNSKRYYSKWVIEFKRMAWSSLKCLFVPLVQLITIDDDLMGTRSADNQLEMLSDRKGDREVQSGDVIANELLRFTLDTRMRRRGEPQLSNVKSSSLL